MNGSLLPLCVFVIVTTKCFFDKISVLFLSASTWLDSSLVIHQIHLGFR